MSATNILPARFSGLVVHGRQLGRTIDMPTANISPDEGLDLPFGVYYSKVYFDNKCFYGISNLGTKPTVQDESRRNIETFIYDFNDNLYDRYIEVELLEFKRPEMKFESFQALSDQMHKDMDDGRKYFFDK